VKSKAPAKINLYLDVTHRRADGYHALDSLVVFARDIYDELTITPNAAFHFDVTGAFADKLSSSADNLVVKAAQCLSRLCDRPLNCSITLHKTLPVAAGIGGGSADAAAVIKGLLRFWDIDEPEGLDDLLLRLGADVPVCYAGKPAFIQGIGEQITPAPPLPPSYIVLVNPGMLCSTPMIFKKLSPPFSTKQPAPKNFGDFDAFIRYLHLQQNDLYAPARDLVPEINDVIHALSSITSCALARMSGAGATCFGLFKTLEGAKNAANKISRAYSHWWVRAGPLSNTKSSDQ
jgi:4-diphosphocytidyl-2-C-methyl-D-erythritol kinase